MGGANSAENDKICELLQGWSTGKKMLGLPQLSEAGSLQRNGGQVQYLPISAPQNILVVCTSQQLDQATSQVAARQCKSHTLQLLTDLSSSLTKIIADLSVPSSAIDTDVINRDVAAIVWSANSDNTDKLPVLSTLNFTPNIYLHSGLSGTHGSTGLVTNTNQDRLYMGRSLCHI